MGSAQNPASATIEMPKRKKKKTALGESLTPTHPAFEGPDAPTAPKVSSSLPLQTAQHQKMQHALFLLYCCTRQK